MFVLPTLYERAIAEADRRRWAGEAGAEEALRSFWGGYLDLLVRNLCINLQAALLNVLCCRGQLKQRTNRCARHFNEQSGASQLRARPGHGTCASLNARVMETTKGQSSFKVSYSS